ncbi:alpha-mannosyltransferase [Ceratobasidium sp. AG-Ba]|nr:alpha-mannosyltransferase [Ceratobasidium sp. AG-Ba]
MQALSSVIASVYVWICLGVVCSIAYAARVHFVGAKKRGQHNHSQRLNKSLSHDEKRKQDEMDRSPGEWRPQSFKYPPITPWTDFDFDKTLPPPYRPFRWGPTYNITMGIRSMDFSEWIQIDNRYAHYHAIRTHRTNTGGTDTVNTMPANEKFGVPGGALAARELVNELGEFLIRRYPHIFRAISRIPPAPNDFSWNNLGEIKEIEITPLGDDLALMLEGKDSRYYFQAGSICTAGFWRMKDKIGHPLERIHEGGRVPQYREKLRDSMNRFFCKLRTDKPVTRNNYFIQIVRQDDDPERLNSIDGDEMGWSDTTNGLEDHFDEPNHAPKAEFLATGEFVAPQPISVDEVGRVRFRTERQSLRRLPRSGAIIFTIRTYLEPVTRLAEEPGVPGRLADAIRSWPPDVAEYKGQRLYVDAVLTHLDERHRYQVDQGIVREDQRDVNYPF